VVGQFPFFIWDFCKCASHDRDEFDFLGDELATWQWMNCVCGGEQEVRKIGREPNLDDHYGMIFSVGQGVSKDFYGGRGIVS